MPHIHDLVDFTVAALIIHGGRVLLVNHKKYSLWLPPGGHVELDEDTDEALFREIYEETGLTADQLEVLSERPRFGDRKSLWPPRWMNIHRINDHHRHIVLVYVLSSKSGTVCLADSAHNDIKWFDAAALDNQELNTTPDVRFYGKEAIHLAS